MCSPLVHQVFTKCSPLCKTPVLKGLVSTGNKTFTHNWPVLTTEGFRNIFLTLQLSSGYFFVSFRVVNKWWTGGEQVVNTVFGEWRPPEAFWSDQKPLCSFLKVFTRFFTLQQGSGYFFVSFRVVNKWWTGSTSGEHALETFWSTVTVQTSFQVQPCDFLFVSDGSDFAADVLVAKSFYRYWTVLECWGDCDFEVSLRKFWEKKKRKQRKSREKREDNQRKQGQETEENGGETKESRGNRGTDREKQRENERKKTENEKPSKTFKKIYAGTF